MIANARSTDQRSYEERRSFTRMHADCKVAIKDPATGETYEARSKNLSGVGILLQCPQRFDDGTLLEILVKPEGSSIMPLHAEIQVIRAHKEGSGYEVAAAFQRVIR